MAGKTINDLTPAILTDLTDADQLMLWNTEDGTTRKVGLDLLRQHDVEQLQGYYARLSNFYFTGGVATETEIPVDDINTWIDPLLTMDAQGLFDFRPAAMKSALADPFNAATDHFSLEGLTIQSSVNFRASMTFEPDEDGGELDARLNFARHSGTTPSTDFQIEDVALTMTQGADIEYPGEPLLTFFVGDTIDTNGAGDAGTCKFQLRSTVPGTVRMRALTWYITQ